MVDVGELPGPCERCRMRPICESSDRWCAKCREEIVYGDGREVPDPPPPSRCTWCGGAKQRDRAGSPWCEVCEKHARDMKPRQDFVTMSREDLEHHKDALRSLSAAMFTLFGATAMLIASNRQARAFANLATPLLENCARLGLISSDEAASFLKALNIERPEP